MTSTQNKIDPKEVYPSVKNMIYGLIIKNVQNHRLDEDEAISEAHMAFMIACETYDRSITQFTQFHTWCHTKVSWALIEMRRTRCGDNGKNANRITYVSPLPDSNDNRPDSFIEKLAHDSGMVEVQRRNSRELFIGLSPNAVRMLELILDNPEGILGNEPATPKQFIRRVREYMISRGTNQFCAKKAQQEIKTHLQAIWAD